MSIASWVVVVRKWRCRCDCVDIVQPENRDAILLLYTLYSSFLFLQIFPVADFFHLVWVLPPVVLLGVYLTYKASRWFQHRRVESSRTACLFGFCKFAVCVLPLFLAAYGLLQGARFLLTADLGPYHDTAVDLDRARGILMPADSARELTQLVRYIDSNTLPGSPIFVVTNQAVIYFLADRPNPTYHNQLLLSAPEEQRALVLEIEQGGVSLVVIGRDEYWRPFWERAYPILFDYLYTHFNLEYQTNMWEVYSPLDSDSNR